jgi:hypothetical protein
MLIVATLPSTLILYLWVVLVWVATISIKNVPIGLHVMYISWHASYVRTLHCTSRQSKWQSWFPFEEVPGSISGPETGYTERLVFYFISHWQHLGCYLQSEHDRLTSQPFQPTDHSNIRRVYSWTIYIIAKQIIRIETNKNLRSMQFVIAIFSVLKGQSGSAHMHLSFRPYHTWRLDRHVTVNIRAIKRIVSFLNRYRSIYVAISLFGQVCHNRLISAF